VICSHLVSLRTLLPTDAHVIAGWAADPEFCRAAGWSSGGAHLQHLRFHEQLISDPPATLLRLGAVYDERLIGYVDIRGEEPHRRELGFVIGDRAHWNRGLGSAAAAAALRFGFEQLDLRWMWAEALDANPGSIRVLQRIGMVETARGEDGVHLDARTFYRCFSITREAWIQSRVP